MPAISWTLSLRSHGQHASARSVSAAATIQVARVHELTLAVPGRARNSDGKTTPGKATYQLAFPGAARVAFVNLEGPATREVSLRSGPRGAAGKTGRLQPIDLSVPQVHTNAEAVRFAESLARVELTNATKLERQVTVVLGFDLASEEDKEAAAAEKRAGARKATKKKTAKKKTAKKKTAKKKTAKKAGRRKATK